jgi:dihydroxyacetone kinase-like protein
VQLTTVSLRFGIGAILERLEAEHKALNDLDGQIGDGDLGITLLKAFRELNRIKPKLPADLGQAFMTAASAVSRVSSSSYGTLLATGLMTVAKATKGRDRLSWTDVPPLLDSAVAAMSARGKATLGDKTVLDALDAAARTASGETDPLMMACKACDGIDQALTSFRDKPNHIGRARIFAERTVGMDDPGMVALRMMAGALSEAAAAAADHSTKT